MIKKFSLRGALLAVAAVSLLFAGSDDSFAKHGRGAGGTVTPSGAPSVSVNGSRFLNTSTGATIQLRGLNMTGLEFVGAKNFSNVSTWGATAPVWTTYGTWGTNIARIPLNSASWLQQTCYYSLTDNTVTFVSTPGSGSTSGTLSPTSANTTGGLWNLPSGTYPLNFNGNSAPYTTGTFTNGSNAVTWPALSTGAPSATGDAISWGSSRSADPQANYRQTVIDAVAQAEAQGDAVILDLHWTSPSFTIGGTSGCFMPLLQSAFIDYTNGYAFWQSIAATFGTQATPPTSTYGTINNAAILFELFNEPYLDTNGGTLTTASGGGGSALTADQALLSGGWTNLLINGASGNVNQDYNLGINYQLTGFQPLLTMIRTAGAHNVLIVSGNSYEQNLKNYTVWWPTDTLSPAQVAQGWHPYQNGYTQSVNFTSTPASGSTGGTLTGSWGLYSGQYPIAFANLTVTGTFTNGSTAVTWSSLAMGAGGSFAKVSGNNYPMQGEAYPAVTYGPWPAVGTDTSYAAPGATDFQFANAVIAAGKPLIITETGQNPFGAADATYTPAAPPVQLQLWWAAQNGVAGVIGWEYNDTRGYNVSGNFSGGGAPFYAAYGNAGQTTIIPVIGNGTTGYKWWTHDHTPMPLISRSGFYGQATAGTAGTMTDALQDWVTGALVGDVFYDTHTTNTAGSTITASTASSVTFSAGYGTPAVADAYYIQTAQMVPTLTGAGASGASTPGYLTSGSVGNVFQTGGSLPVGLCYNISSYTSTGTTALLIHSNNSNATYDFDSNNDGGHPYNMWGAYTIDGSTTTGSGSCPADADSSWVALATHASNVYQSTNDLVTVTGYNWVRMHITGYATGNVNNDITIHQDIYDASKGVTGNIAVVGDSWAANAFRLQVQNNGDPAGNYAAGELVPNTNALALGQGGSPGYRNQFPYSVTDIGQAGWTSTQIYGGLSTYLPLVSGTVAIAYNMVGLNDLPTANSSSHYSTNIPAIVAAEQADGMTVMISQMPYVTDTQHSAGFTTYIPLENTAITNAIAAGAIAGPNLRQLFYGFVGGSPVGSTGVTAVSSGGGTVTITDTSASYGSIWTTNSLSSVGGTLNDITTHTVVGPLVSNTTTTITATGTATVSIGDIYNVTYVNYTIGTGSTAGTANCLSDNSQNWPINGEVGEWVADITQGVFALVTSNNSNTVCFTAGWSGPGGSGARSAAGDTYSLNGQTLVMQSPYGDGESGPTAPQSLHAGATGWKLWRIQLDWAVAAAEQGL